MNLEKIRTDMIALYEETFGKKIQKKHYAQDFEEIKNRHHELFEMIAGVIEESEDHIQEVATFVPEYAAEKLSAFPSKRKRDVVVIDHNMNMVAYFIPLLGEISSPQAKPLVEATVAKWNQLMPENQIGVSSFSAINGGFRKGLCYITTATLNSLNKPDDCYELSLLRNYRDEYLLSTQEGNAIVEEYYNIAPTIVKKIDRNADAAAIYQNIWSDYLSPCVRLIEENKNEDCKELYRDMVLGLEKKYVFS